MKRTISLVLCLIMILSLLTGLAAANTESSGFSHSVDWGADNDWLCGGRGFWMTLDGTPIQESETCTVRLDNPKLGSLSYNAEDTKWPWGFSFNESYPGQRGNIVVTTNGSEYRIPISTADDPVFGLYGAETYASADYIPLRPNAELTLTAGQTTTIYLRVAKSFTIASIEVENLTKGKQKADENWIYQPISFTAAEPGRYSARIVLNWKENGETMWTDWNLRFMVQTKLLQAEAPYTGNYTIPDGLGFVPSTAEDPFGVYFNSVLVDEKQEIYFGVGALGGPKGVDRLTRAEAHIGPDSSFDITCTPLFYVIEEGNVVPLADQSSMNAANVSLELYPLSAEDGMLACKNTPATYAGPSQWPNAKQYVINEASQGDYLVAARATVDGTEYTALGNFAVLVKEEITLEAVTVAEAQERMAAFLKENGPLTSQQRLMVRFTGEGPLVGPLVIPRGLEGSGVMGNGQVFYGGIENAGGIDKLHFRSLLMKDGAMTAEQAKEQAMASDTVPNYAIYGKIPGGRGGCTFEGFYHAIHIGPETMMFNVGGTNNTFTNNKVAVYVEHENPNGGNTFMQWCHFENNDTAIWFKQMPAEGINLSYVSVANTRFINNDVDVRNDTKQVFWMPMSYFWHGTGNYGIHSDKNSNNWQPVTEPKPKNWKTVPSVIASPVAVDPNFRIPGYFYAKNIYMSADMQALYPLAELDEVTTVYGYEDGETEVTAGVILTADTYAAEQTAAVQQTFSLHRLGGEPAAFGLYRLAETQAAFDATMTRTETEDQITLTIGAIPEGYGGQVLVPCDESWYGAEVYHDGDLLQSQWEDSTVSFAALETGASETYEICRVEDPGEDPGEGEPGDENPGDDKPGQNKPAVNPGPKPGSTPAAKPAVPYADVNPGDWYYDAVAFVTEEGLMNGVGGGRFAPDADLSRAMMWTLLARLDGADTEGGSSWYEKSRLWAMAEGVSDGTDPDGSITREQLVTMLWRYAGMPLAVGDLDAFSDGDDVSDWAESAMIWAVSEEILNGMDGKLEPQGRATRAQMAAIFLRYCSMPELTDSI